MSFWSRLLGLEKKSSSLDLLREIMAGRATKTGKVVNVDTALQTTAVLACVRVIADGIAQVPFKIFRSLDAGGREVMRDHPVHQLLSVAPNEYQTAFEFLETTAIHAALTGNAYAYKIAARGKLAELLPLDPLKTRVVYDDATQTKAFEHTKASGERVTLRADQVWHIKGPSWDAVRGLDAVNLAREAIGLSLAAEETHSKLHKHGARPGGAISVSGRLTGDQHAQMQAWIEANHAGSENAFSTMILDRDAKYTPYAVSGVDSQHLETRRYQVEEICRAFRVMPIMAGYSDKASTYASAEQMFLAHVVHTLSPWYVRLEQSIRASLLTPEEVAGGIYPKFIANGLLRGASADRADFYAKALGSGGSPAWITPNEIRELEEMNPIDGGDKLPVSTNPAPASPANSGA